MLDAVLLEWEGVLADTGIVRRDLLLRALADEGLFQHPAVEREGWVDAGEARAFYDQILARQASGDPDYTDDVWPMWIVASVELWMREVADRSSSDRRSRHAR